MGDPKFPKRSYDSPSHPWEGERISNEAELVKRYGLKNKKELWKAQSVLRGLRRQSRNLQARLRYGDQQAQLETDKLLQRCGRLGYLPMQGGSLDDVLALDMESVLGRRLQTIVKQKRLASTFREARQMITHGHVFVEGRKVTIPGYVITRSEEGKIEYNPRSPFSDDLHPTRVQMAEKSGPLEGREKASEEVKEEVE